MTDPKEPTRHWPSLSAEDAEALDALIEARTAESEGRGGKGQADTGAQAARAEKMQSLLALIGQHPAEDPPRDLVETTMARVRGAETVSRMLQQRQNPDRPLFSFKWREVLTAAAVMMIAASLLIPVLSRSTADQRRLACESNLMAAGAGLSQYAAANSGVMPRLGSWPGEKWYQVGHAGREGVVPSNSAHLMILVRQRYVSPDDLTCPENAFAPRKLAYTSRDWPDLRAVSYSSQNQFTPQAIRLEDVTDTPIIADRNPLFVLNGQTFVFRTDIPGNSPSGNHARLKGQNMLVGDGSAQWSEEPRIGEQGSDNAWLIEGVEHYLGNEFPVDPHDSFLVP